jgi:pimeloyl-ACP methyl ester carboxylesterase
MNSKYHVYKNAQINYEFTQTNSSKTLICLHGFLEFKEIFDFITYIDLGDSYNILKIDLLGQGKSDSIGYIHSMEDQADMIFDICTALGINNLTILGHSMGGYVALAFLELYPEFVNQIILLNSSAKEDSSLRKQNRLRGIELVKKNTTIFIQMAVTNLFTDLDKIRLANEIRNFKSKAVLQTTQGVIANMYGMKDRKDRCYLLFNSTPIHYIYGSEDNLIPPNDILEETKNSNVILHSIDGGHMLWLEQPLKIKDLLKKIL